MTEIKQKQEEVVSRLRHEEVKTVHLPLLKKHCIMHCKFFQLFIFYKLHTCIISNNMNFPIFIYLTAI